MHDTVCKRIVRLFNVWNIFLCLEGMCMNTFLQTVSNLMMHPQIMCTKQHMYSPCEYTHLNIYAVKHCWYTSNISHDRWRQVPHWSDVADLNILVLFYICALNSQLAGLGVKVNSLHTQCQSCPNSGAAHTSSRGLGLHFPEGRREIDPMVSVFQGPRCCGMSRQSLRKKVFV